MYISGLLSSGQRLKELRALRAHCPKFLPHIYFTFTTLTRKRQKVTEGKAQHTLAAPLLHTRATALHHPPGSQILAEDSGCRPGSSVANLNDVVVLAGSQSQQKCMCLQAVPL